MSPSSSLRALRETWDFDRALQRHGASFGFYFWHHYMGRFYNRFHRTPPTTALSLRLESKRGKLLGNGKTVRFPIGSPYFGMLRGIVLDCEYDIADAFPPAEHPSPRILDLGANIGLGTLYLSLLYPKATFICVEPDPRNQQLLRQTVGWNSVSASVVEAAIGARPGRLMLRFGDDPTCSSLESSPMHFLRSRVEVVVATVPELLRNAAWDRVDVVKIDIEGSEDELLSIENQWLERVGGIVMEIHPNTSPERIAGFLRPYGFFLRKWGCGREPVYVAAR